MLKFGRVIWLCPALVGGIIDIESKRIVAGETFRGCVVWLSEFGGRRVRRLGLWIEAPHTSAS
jgi:hypothetical protein